MAVVGVARVDREGGAFKVDIDAVEAVFAHDGDDRRDEGGNATGVGEGEVLAAASEGDHDLFAAALYRGDIGLELLQGLSCGRVELHGALSGVVVGRGEGDDDDIPLRRDLRQRENLIRRAESFPVADQLVAIGRTALRDGGNDGCGRRGSVTTHGAWLGGSGERLRVRKAVSGA